MPHSKRSWSSTLRLNCKILFHTAVRGNIKATRDFLYLKGSTSVYSVLFLNLVGQMPLPSQASQSQHSIQVKLCPFGPGGTFPLPNSLSACICRGSQEHQPRNLGDTERPPSCRRCGSGQNAPCRGSCATPFPLTSGSGWAVVLRWGNWYFLSVPVTSHSFLLVSGGFHIGRGWGREKNGGGGEIKRPTRFWLSFAASTWCKRKLVGEDP